jgi:prevent-host-death family protein
MASEKPSRVTATEARVRFGEMMRRAERGETLLVERGGEPKAVIISIEEYGRLSERDRRSTETEPDVVETPEWQRRLVEVREKASRELTGKNTDWDQIIHDMREERSQQLLETLESGKSVNAAERDAQEDE